MVIEEYEFKAYEEVRLSGKTNMFNTANVEELSGLSREKILAIMNGYSELKETYDEIKRNQGDC